MATMNQHHGINIFISSPGDVEEERNICEEIINNVSISMRDTIGYHLLCMKWEHLDPQASLPWKKIQDEIMKMIDNCQVFILILYKRYGQEDPTKKISRTEMEINYALKLLRNGKDIKFLSYFKKRPKNPDIGDQEKKIIRLEEKLERVEDVLYKQFTTPADFKNKFTHNLYHTLLLRSIAPTQKQTAWSKFWNLGMVEGQTSPKLAIIYPTMNKKLFSDDSDRIWLKRLMPLIPYEDFSAVEYIERTLRAINFSGFKTCTAARLPEDWADMNRVWICLPRNIPGDEQLKKYENRVKFIIESEGETYHIKWFPRAGVAPIIVHSPLAAYLREQRNGIEEPAWGPKHGRIIARDYAVLARFAVKNKMKESIPLKDYFFAGIRGLGTWGAGWYLLNKCEAFQKLDENKDTDIQLLLEATYKDEEITEVKDVSNHPQSYFDSENSEGVIHDNIQKYNIRKP